MSHLPRIYIYLTITTTLLLAITLSTSAQGSNSVGNTPYDQFVHTNEQCHLRSLREENHRIRVHSDCYVDVQLKKCKGNCRSLTDFQLDPPYLTKDCACCKPSEVTHETKVFRCYRLNSRNEKKYLDEQVKIKVPQIKQCGCQKCGRTLSG